MLWCVRDFLPLWYISRNGDQLFNREMITAKNRRGAGRGWRGLLAMVAICSLTVTLATRFSVPAFSQVHTVKSIDSRCGEPKRQRLARDSVRLAEPVANWSWAEPDVRHSDVITSEPLRSSDLLSVVFYNRPPPFSSAFFL